MKILSHGKYFVNEVKAKEGYEKIKEKIEINIKYNEEINLKINNDKIKIIIPNKKLPKTGY